MLTVTNLLRGYCEVEVRGEYPERFLNICARCGVEFWKTARIDGGYRVRVRRKSAELMEILAPRAFCTAEVISRRGFPFLAASLGRRWLFVAGILMFAAGMWYLSGRVWEIEVVGNETVKTEQVLRELKAAGVGIGTRISTIDPETLGDEMLLRIPELRWFTVNVNGSIATAELRERVEPPTPVDKGAPRNLVAAADGIIEEVIALDGAPMVKKGDTVMRGELLVSGIVDTAAGAKLVYARGAVKARTWRIFEAKMPQNLYIKTHTGRKITKYALVFAGKRINLYFSGSNLPALCDKITEKTRLSLGDTFALPVVLERTVYSEYTCEYAAASEERLRGILESVLRAQLESECADAEISGVSVEFSASEGMLHARLTAECIEDIASPAEIAGVPWQTNGFSK